MHFFDSDFRFEIITIHGNSPELAVSLLDERFDRLDKSKPKSEYLSHAILI